MDRPGMSTASSAIVASSPLDPVLSSQKTKPITASHVMKANLHHDAHIAKRYMKLDFEVSDSMNRLAI